MTEQSNMVTYRPPLFLDAVVPGLYLEHCARKTAPPSRVAGVRRSVKVEHSAQWGLVISVLCGAVAWGCLGQTIFSGISIVPGIFLWFFVLGSPLTLAHLAIVLAIYPGGWYLAYRQSTNIVRVSEYLYAKDAGFFDSSWKQRWVRHWRAVLRPGADARLCGENRRAAALAWVSWVSAVVVAVTVPLCAFLLLGAAVDVLGEGTWTNMWRVVWLHAGSLGPAYPFAGLLVVASGVNIAAYCQNRGYAKKYQDQLCEHRAQASTA